jgi:hypothetical protein
VYQRVSFDFAQDRPWLAMDDLAALAAARDILVRLYENEGHVQFADQVPYWQAREYANSNTHSLDRYDVEV